MDEEESHDICFHHGNVRASKYGLAVFFPFFLSFTKIPRKPFPTVGVEWSSENVTNIDAVTPSNKMCLKAQTVQHIG